MRVIAVALLAGTSLALAACGGAAEESDEPVVEASDASPVASQSAAASPSPSASASASPTPSPSASAQPAAAPVAAVAPAAFNQCKACHSVDPGDHGIGPSLAGVFGKRAGRVPGFEFSDAMKGSNLTLNEATLNRYLENPQAVVPGTTMSFAGVKDAARRKAIVDYLKTL